MNLTEGPRGLRLHGLGTRQELFPRSRHRCSHLLALYERLKSGLGGWRDVNLLHPACSQASWCISNESDLPQEETVVKGGSGKLDTPPPGETNLLEGLKKNYGANV